VRGGNLGSGQHLKRPPPVVEYSMKINRNAILFEKLWAECSKLPLQKEYKFCDGRKFKSDYSLVDHGILIELEGGTWSGGRHVRGKGYANDCEKYNIATRIGWRVIRLTTDMITKEWVRFIVDMVEESCQQRPIKD